MRGPQPRIALSNAKRRKILPEWPGPSVTTGPANGRSRLPGR